MSSYVEKEKTKKYRLSPTANLFVPEATKKLEDPEKEQYEPAVRLKEPRTAHSMHSAPGFVENHGASQRLNFHHPQEGSQNQQQPPTDTSIIADNEDQHKMMDIMKKQNEITTLLNQQQCVSSLPKREIHIFDGDPLKYHAFMKAFENGVERNTNSFSDREYFLEQYTSGHPKELVKSCHYLNPERGYNKAKVLLQQQFENEQKVAHAYMERIFSWPPIKADDVKALEEYNLFLRGCSNVIEEVQYMDELDIPANMISVIKKLPYKLRDKWRTAACELQ